MRARSLLLPASQTLPRSGPWLVARPSFPYDGVRGLPPARTDLPRRRCTSELYENRDMAAALFRNVNLRGAAFVDVNLGEATIRNANLANVTIEDANIVGLTIYGIRVDRLIDAELDRRDPQRVPPPIPPTPFRPCGAP